jgi:hypothetical protein
MSKLKLKLKLIDAMPLLVKQLFLPRPLLWLRAESAAAAAGTAVGISQQKLMPRKY